MNRNQAIVCSQFCHATATGVFAPRGDWNQPEINEKPEGSIEHGALTRVPVRAASSPAAFVP
jgi:hypothetical protein